MQTLNSLGEETLRSLGLAGWSPSGMVQQALEAIHVSMDLPWWGAIVLGRFKKKVLGIQTGFDIQRCTLILFGF